MKYQTNKNNERINYFSKHWAANKTLVALSKDPEQK